MKNLLFVFVFAAFAACGGGGSEATIDSTTVTTDGTAITSTDTTGTGMMNTDTTSMSTPH